MKTCDFIILSVSAIMVAAAWMMMYCDTDKELERPRHGTVHIEEMDE